MSIYVDVEKQVGDFRLKVQFSAQQEVVSLLGASGSGKSMTLKCIAGIEHPDQGRIVVDGVVVYDSKEKICLPPQRRRVGYLFQNYALFPHMTVEQNLAAAMPGVKQKHLRRQRAEQMVEQFGLRGLERRYPHQLSGGQQQRVALGRIMMSEPSIVLLDEPFSALDSHLRFRMEQQMRETMRNFGKSVVMVSHDRDEVFRMADQIVVLENGAVSTCGGKHQVFAQPGTRSAAVLTGCKNISAIQKTGETSVYALDWGMHLELGRPVGDATHLGIRMHEVGMGPGENEMNCVVREWVENPFSVTVWLQHQPGGAAADVGWELDKNLWKGEKGQPVLVHFPAEKLLLLKG